MNKDQQHRIYFGSGGKPTDLQPDGLLEWVAERAAREVCMRLGRNTVTAADIDAQFDAARYLWGRTPANAAADMADRYYQYMIASREPSDE